MNNNTHTAFTLITGASYGIGKALAENCAARGHNVLLVALPEPMLAKVTHDLKKKYPQQQFDCLGIDLTEKSASQEVLGWCNKNNYGINILMNNAGLGNSGPFMSRDSDFYYTQMQLNMVSVVMLTHLFIPLLEQHPKAYILNVASMAAYYDIPFKGIYSASKRFIYSFSRSLRKELENSKISITVLCPAMVNTNTDVLVRSKELGMASKLTQQSPKTVAEYTIARMLKGKAVVIPGVFPKIYKVFGGFVPYPVKLRLLANAFIRQSR